MTFYCPACWSEISSSDTHCPECGADVHTLDSQSFVEKLRAALRHPEPQTAVRAAWVLGERRERSAVPDLLGALENAQDSFLAEAAAEALGKIGDATALAALGRSALEGTVRVRSASKTAIELICEQELQQSLRERNT